MTDMIDLLPCPFCGGPDTRHFNNPDEFGRPSHGIQCANGECWVCGPECETPSEAIAAWNRRAPLPPAPDAVQALVKAAERAERVMNDPYCEPGNSITNTLAELRDALAAIRAGGKP